MSEVYTLRAPENFNYNDDRRSSPANIKDYHGQKPEMQFLKANNDNQIATHKLLKPPSSSIYGNSNSSRILPELYHLKVEGNNTENSNHRSTPALTSEKQKSPIPYQSSYGQKPEMYYISFGGEKTPEYGRQSPYTINVRQQPKLNDTITDPHSPYPKTITLYMITASNTDNFSLDIPSTPSLPKRSKKKKQLVSFSVVDNNDKYVVSNKQRHFPTAIHDVPTNIDYRSLSQSKAVESIQRSMNKYRFGGN